MLVARARVLRQCANVSAASEQGCVHTAFRLAEAEGALGASTARVKPAELLSPVAPSPGQDLLLTPPGRLGTDSEPLLIADLRTVLARSAEPLARMRARESHPKMRCLLAPFPAHAQ